MLIASVWSMCDVHHRTCRACAAARGSSRRISWRSFAVEVRQRLVHQAHRRLGDDRPAERDALHADRPRAATACARAAPTAEQVADALEACRRGLPSARVAPSRRTGCSAHRQMRAQRVRLEHHRDAPPSRRQPVTFASDRSGCALGGARRVRRSCAASSTCRSPRARAIRRSCRWRPRNWLSSTAAVAPHYLSGAARKRVMSA